MPLPTHTVARFRVAQQSKESRKSRLAGRKRVNLDE
jgi:hypothetical protein